MYTQQAQRFMMLQQKLSSRRLYGNYFHDLVNLNWRQSSVRMMRVRLHSKFGEEISIRCHIIKIAYTHINDFVHRQFVPYKNDYACTLPARVAGGTFLESFRRNFLKFQKVSKSGLSKILETQNQPNFPKFILEKQGVD